MEESFKAREEACPQLLDLIPQERDWVVKDAGGGGRGSDLRASQVEVQNLELRLGLPAAKEEEDPSVLSLALFSKSSKTTTNNKNNNPCAGLKRGFFTTLKTRAEGLQQQQRQQEAGFLHLRGRPGLKKSGASPQAALHQSLGRKTAQAPGNAAGANMNSKTAHEAPGNVAGANMNSQTRAASIPAVGWPPIGSFRKNLSTNSSKPSPEPQSRDFQPKVKLENYMKGLFVKINMEGIPIGRKIDLSTHDSYEKLSLAVEELFQDLLAAQKDPSTADTSKDEEEKRVFTGLLDGTGEYTLVYEDNEGDRMLVGDVPWDMFVSMAKRLRVLKSTDLTAICSGPVCRKRIATEC